MTNLSLIGIKQDEMHDEFSLTLFKYLSELLWNSSLALFLVFLSPSLILIPGNQKREFHY